MAISTQEQQELDEFTKDAKRSAGAAEEKADCLRHEGKFELAAKYYEYASQIALGHQRSERCRNAQDACLYEIK